MTKVILDHIYPHASVPVDYGKLDAGDSTIETLEIVNNSQFELLVTSMSLDGMKYTEILNPVTEIEPNSTYLLKIKIDVPMDIREPVKGQFRMEAIYVMK